MSAFPLAAIAQQEAQGTLASACGLRPGVACHLVWDITHNATVAKVVDSWVAEPAKIVLQILLVVMLALVARWLIHRFIDRVTGRAEGSLMPKRIRAKAAAVLEASPVVFSERRRQRAQALGSILRSIASVVIFGVAALTILGDLGLNLAPLLASAGVVGIAIGFGAQNVVKDFLSGIFMLLEDQYGVGDVIDAGEATGSVEAVGLRTTRLRDVNGVVWHIRNGTIDRIGNQSQSWSRAVVDLPVAYDQDVHRARETMKQAATAMWREPAWSNVILEEPEVWGIQALLTNAVLMRVVAKTSPLKQWQVAREMRERLMKALGEQGVTVGVPGTDSGSQIESS
ncbi:MAG: mechanosensitive ion channel family protein [Micromonosporaceae bacterium]